MSLFDNVKAQLLVVRRLERDRGFSTGFIYIIEQYPYAKIGYATDPESRLSNLQTSSPTKLRLLCVAPGSIKLEQGIHTILRNAGLCVRGEWYLLDDILHVFEAFHRITMAAIHSARGEIPSRALAINDEAYYFRFQWCCHDHYAHGGGTLAGHLIADHQLDYDQAAEMARKYREDPTLIGIKCRGESMATNLEQA